MTTQTCYGTETNTEAYCGTSDAAAGGNPPGLSAIAYRAGNYATFRKAMLHRLIYAHAVPGMISAEPDDFTIALLDAWAMVGEVCCFYQERLANEAYLRTAGEHRSLLELGRMVGYELRPALSAEAELAFTVDDAPGTPGYAVIGTGVKVQSIPGPGEQMRVYETIEHCEVQAAWNCLRPPLTKPQQYRDDLAHIYVRGATANLKPGDYLLLVDAQGNQCLNLVANVLPDLKAGTTRIDLITVNQGLPVPGALSATAQHVAGNLDMSPVAEFACAVGNDTMPASLLLAQAATHGWEPALLAQQLTVAAQAASPPPAFSIYTFRRRACIFGHNSPENEDGNRSAITRLFDSMWQYSIGLDTIYPGVLPASLGVLITGGRWEAFCIGAIEERTRVTEKLVSTISVLMFNTALKNKYPIRTTTVLVQSEQLPLAESPDETPISGSEIELDGVYLDLPVGRKMILTGERIDLPGAVTSELLTIATVDIAKGRTRLTCTKSLVGTYRRASVTINANIVRASEGETTCEVLGSGDGKQAFQRFPLRRTPVCFLNSPDGPQSTLAVYVNDLRWDEAPFFHAYAPHERIYLTRRDEQGATGITFGDGRTGARLPGGQENVRAIYRSGGGLAGRVAANQLSLLASRPAGIRAVTNPLPAEGGDDAQQPDEARRNVPLTTATLGRVVSRRDYEKYARAFGGVAKARADWMPVRGHHAMVITIADPTGNRIPNDAKLIEDLTDALRKAGDPYVPLHVVPCQLGFFQLRVNIKIEPTRPSAAQVKFAVVSALRTAFAFPARDFCQSVTLSEVITIVQRVPGVVAADVDALDVMPLATPGIHETIPAYPPGVDIAGQLLGAQLRLLDETSLTIGAMP